MQQTRALYAPYGVYMLQLANEKASFEACAVTTGYAALTNRIEPHLLENGDVCIRLESGNIASITASKSPDTTQVILTIITWDQPR